MPHDSADSLVDLALAVIGGALVRAFGWCLSRMGNNAKRVATLEENYKLLKQRVVYLERHSRRNHTDDDSFNVFLGDD